jgi:hypothetical protein
MSLFSKKPTSSFDEPVDTVEAFERQMRIERLKTGGKTKEKRDVSRYIIAGIIAALLMLAIKWLDHFNFFVLGGIVFFVAGFYLYMEWKQFGKDQDAADTKHDLLRFKYDDPAVVHKLQKGVIWKGESVEQLVDSLGAPNSIKPLNGRDTNTAIWIYDQRVAYESTEGGKKKLVFETGAGIELKEGVIVGWQRK